MPKEYSGPVGIVDADSIMYQLSWYYQVAEILPIEPFDETLVPNAIHTSVDSFLTKLKCQMNVDDLQLHFTASKRNEDIFREHYGRKPKDPFRDHVTEAYKDNRNKDDNIFAYGATLRSLLRYDHTYLHDSIEADDAVQHISRLHPDWIVSSCDKDVWNSNPNPNWVYDKRRKWTHVSKQEAEWFHYYQCLVGDPSDNIKGIPGVGPKHKLVKTLDKSMHPVELWEAVVAAYEAKGLGVDDAVINMRLLSTHQLRTDSDGKTRLHLWEPTDEFLKPYWG